MWNPVAYGVSISPNSSGSQPIGPLAQMFSVKLGANSVNPSSSTSAVLSAQTFSVRLPAGALKKSHTVSAGRDPVDGWKSESPTPVGTCAIQTADARLGCHSGCGITATVAPVRSLNRPGREKISRWPATAELLMIPSVVIALVSDVIAIIPLINQSFPIVSYRGFL